MHKSTVKAAQPPKPKPPPPRPPRPPAPPPRPMNPSGRLINVGRTFHPNMLLARDVGSAETPVVCPAVKQADL